MQDENLDIEITKVQQAISSCVGALITSICTTPLDVVKVRLQANGSNLPLRFDPFKRTAFNPTLLSEGACICTSCITAPKYSIASNTPNYITNKGSQYFKNSNKFHFHNLKLACMHTKASISLFPFYYESRNMIKMSLDTMQGIVNKEGVRSLWSGLSPTLLMSVPGTVIYFGMYDNLKRKLGYRNNDITNIHIPIFAGILSRVTAVIMVNPLEVVRTKMQSASLTYLEIVDAMRLSLHINGPLFMFRGLIPTLLRDVPFSAIYWCGYEFSKIQHYNATGEKHPPFWLTFLAGGLSGTVAAILTSPFDVVKTRLQIELGKASSTKQVSTLHIVNQLYKRHGWQALYAGIVPRVIKVAPACAIMISTYELGKFFFREYNYNATQKSK